MSETADPGVLTAEEAAGLLPVSTKTLLALARDGSLPGTNVDRAWRFLWADLVAYVRGGREHTAGVVAS